MKIFEMYPSFTSLIVLLLVCVVLMLPGCAVYPAYGYGGAPVGYAAPAVQWSVDVYYPGFCAGAGCGYWYGGGYRWHSHGGRRR